jgi:exopolyphosphatase/pppGpp-phosphohydrolase
MPTRAGHVASETIQMERFAAIDIGSNSIRLQVAGAVPRPNALPVLETLINHRAVTRLGEGVFRKRARITRKAMDASLEVLKEFAKVCRDFNVTRRRAVATSAVRDARNRLDFLRRAEKILAVPVEVISGPEEATLVHLGVRVRWPGRLDESSLVVDLGGGSVQLVYGSSSGVPDALSRPLGAVRLTELFLKHDPPKRRELRDMHEYIDEKLEIVRNAFPTRSIRRVIVTSGTAAAVVCALREIPSSDRGRADRNRISLADVERLYDRVVGLSLKKRRSIVGLSTRRAEVIVAGVAVLSRILRAFEVTSFTYSSAGVRDGIIADSAMTGSSRAPRQQIFQVFLCHNSRDKTAVRTIARQLRDRAILPWLDEDEIAPGTPWQPELERQIESIEAAAVFVGADGIGPWQRAEVDGLLRQFLSRRCPVIPVLLPDAKGEPQLPLFLGGMMAVDFRHPYPDPLEALIWGIRRERTTGRVSERESTVI